MFVVGNFLGALASIVDLFLQMYMWIVIAAALMSWVNPDPYSSVVRFLHRMTDPVFNHIRRLLPLNAGGIDFSPMIAWFLIMFLRLFVVQTIIDVSRRM